MIASVEFLTVMVGVALAVTAVAPLVLVVLWLKDWNRGHLW